MRRLNRDTVIAVLLLCLVGFLFYSSFNIRTPAFDRLAPGQMDPGLWPRIILIGLSIMGVIYLFQSIIDPPPPGEKRGGLVGWYRHYKNPIWCFAGFAAFLILIPQLGMLIAGIIFVFSLMSFLGPKDWSAVKRHIWTTLGTVGGMWFIFACLLEVQLPKGNLTGTLDEWMLVNICGLVASVGQLFAGLDGGTCHVSTLLAV
jgi:Tripartite tricarboxylate transporter TctB family